MADAPILYSFRRCPYAMRARLALLASGQAVEHREILLRAKPAAMLAASPKGTVPVLVLPDGTVAEQSLDIMRLALARRAPASSSVARALALRPAGQHHGIDAPAQALSQVPPGKAEDQRRTQQRQHHADQARAGEA